MTTGQHRREDVLQPFRRLGRSPHTGCDNGSKRIERCTSLGFIKAELAADCCDVHRSSPFHKTPRLETAIFRPQSWSALNVSQSWRSLASMPFLNQRTRCSELPWVKASGTT